LNFLSFPSWVLIKRIAKMASTKNTESIKTAAAFAEAVKNFDGDAAV
jgi:hypothetical protein